MKKIIAKLTACLLAASSLAVSAGAEVYYDVTYPGMDDVYRLDVTSTDGAAETVTYEENILCMLGIMSKDSNGSFSPDRKLSKGEYEAALRAVYSGEKVDFEKYNETYKNQKVYQMEIVRGLVGLIENTAISEDDDIKRLADNSGILDGVTYTPNKEMTRHEFAVVLWNTLNSEYVQYGIDGDSVEIKVEDGKTILNGKLNVYEVKGMLNAVWGLNVFSTKTPRQNRVEIGRAAYNTNGIAGLEEYLGKTVHAYAKYDEDTEEMELLNIEIDAKDESVTFGLDDFESIDNGYLYYDEGQKSKKVKISGLKNIVYNGDFAHELDDAMFDGHGTVTVGKSEKSGDYDVIIIKNYKNFLAKKYLATDKKLYLSYNAKYNGEYFVDLDIDDGTVICKIDGKRSELDSLKPKMSISMIQNKEKTYTEILASNTRVSGAVVQSTDDGWIIGETEYFTDEEYEKLSLDSSNGAENIKSNSVGTFYVTPYNVIVGFEADGAARFALLKRMWRDDDDEETIFVRLFDISGEWCTYELAERVEVDGVKNDAKLSVPRIQSALDNYSAPTPIRYKLSGEKIKFIDTLNNDRAEELDSERMTMAGSFSGKTTWVKGWDMGMTSDYHVSDATPMFIMPTDKEKNDEKKYSVSVGSAIPGDTDDIVFEAYNTDKFKCARLAIMKGSAETFGTGYGKYMYIKEVTERVVADEVVTGITCYLFTRNSLDIDERFYELPDDWKEKWSVTDLKGYFVAAFFDGTEIAGLDLVPGRYVKDWQVVPNSKGETTFFDRDIASQTDWVSGTVIDTDPSRNYMLLDCGTSGIKSVVNTACVIGRVDTKASKVKIEGITTDAINPGDRVFYMGSLRRAYYILVMAD